MANRAVLLDGSDPEVYRVRAAVLSQERNFREAINDLEHAIALSPNDADLWIELGDYRAENYDTTPALNAYRHATRLAPGYGRARQLLGTCLLEAGQAEEAFAELRHASTITPARFSKNIELAWQTYEGDPQAMYRALQPQSVQERIALGLFFANHSVRDQAILLMKDAGNLPAEERLSLLQELLDTDKFDEAYAVWSAGRDESSNEEGFRPASITDGSFEGELSLDRGFGWTFNHDTRAVNIWLDQGAPYSGKQSLRLDWHGDPDHSSRILQQRVLVLPETRYRLTFAGRTQSLTTICPPYITVTSGKGENEILLGQSTPLTEGSSGWRKYTLDFATPDSSRAIQISVKRVAGSEGACPIFGSVWFDDFSLARI
ncbi:MAG TPA: hypothetical protein VLB68_32365 [Pyrinomonadaceae bacterium]|nr:hypothetical protein [Pyrinomonadaceae bacterium]